MPRRTRQTYEDAGQPPFDPRAGASKRQRKTSSPSGVRTIEDALAEETICLCLSHLEARDLAVVARLSSYWNRLANDTQLWKSLFLRSFSLSRFRSAPSFKDGSRTWKDLFKIARNWENGVARPSSLNLRSMFLADLENVDVGCRGEQVADENDVTSGVDGEINPRRARREDEGPYDRSAPSSTIVQFLGRHFFTASRQPPPSTYTIPPVHVHLTQVVGDSLFMGSITSATLKAHQEVHPAGSSTITDLRLDDRTSNGQGAAEGNRLAVFYSSGHFVIFRIFLDDFDLSNSFRYEEEYVHLEPTTFSVNPKRIAMSRFHSPILVTCTTDFQLDFHLISEPRRDERTKVELASPPFRSNFCWWPVVISLDETNPSSHSQSPLVTSLSESEEGDKQQHDDQRFRVTVAYSTPYYQASAMLWTVGVQEFSIGLRSPKPIEGDPELPYIDISMRHATAIPPSHSSPSLRSPLSARRRASQAITPSSPPFPHMDSTNLVTSIENNYPFILTSRTDNTIQVFKIVDSYPSSSTPSSSSSPGASTSTRHRLKIEHQRTLFGHTSSVQSLALERNTMVATQRGSLQSKGGGVGRRCVSGSRDGRLKVWELNHGDGMEDSGVTIVERDDPTDPSSSTTASGGDAFDHPLTGLLTPFKSSAGLFDASSSSSSSSSPIKWIGFDEEKIACVMEKPVSASMSGREWEKEGGSPKEIVRVFRFD